MSYDGKLTLEDATDEQIMEELIHARLNEEQCTSLVEFAEDVLAQKFGKTLVWRIE